MKVDIDITIEWFSNIGSIPELAELKLLDSEEEELYLSFELNRLDSIDYGKLDDNFDPLLSFIRQTEYEYNNRNRCGSCGYFEQNEYNSQLTGYCSKLGIELEPTRNTMLCTNY